jgi:hypothetical protein
VQKLVARLNALVSEPFARITYTEAINYLLEPANVWPLSCAQRGAVVSLCAPRFRVGVACSLTRWLFVW